MIRALLEQRCPSGFELGQLSSGDPTRQEFPGSGLKPRLRWHLSLVEFFQPLAPPGELDCAERRLRGTGDHVTQSIVDVDQRIECGPQPGRPVKPDEVAVAQLSDR